MIDLVDISDTMQYVKHAMEYSQHLIKTWLEADRKVISSFVVCVSKGEV